MVTIFIEWLCYKWSYKPVCHGSRSFTPRKLIEYLNIDLTERNKSTSYRSLFEKLSESTKHKIVNNVAYYGSDTPFELAVSSHRFDCDFVKFLIKNGAKVTV